MAVKKIGIGGFCQHLANVLPRLFTIPQLRIKIDDPCPAPARVAAAVCKAYTQGFRSRGGKLWCFIHRDLIGRIQAVQLRHMAMSRLCFLVLLHPFHDSSCGIDADRRQLFERRIDLLL